MVILSALIGLLAGIILTILSEAVKKASLKKTVASKLYTESISILRDLLEDDDMLNIAVLSKSIYNNQNSKGLSEQKKNLTTLLEGHKKTIDREKIKNDILKFKEDNFKITKANYLINIVEESYKKDTYFLSYQEISYLSPYVQSSIIEMKDNSFQAVLSFKFYLMRIQEPEMNIEHCINEGIEMIMHIAKAYKDRDLIFNYSRKIIKRSLIRNIFN